jgi:hypothetical protein
MSIDTNATEMLKCNRLGFLETIAKESYSEKKFEEE